MPQNEVFYSNNMKFFAQMNSYLFEQNLGLILILSNLINIYFSQWILSAYTIGQILHFKTFFLLNTVM